MNFSLTFDEQIPFGTWGWIHAFDRFMNKEIDQVMADPLVKAFVKKTKMPLEELFRIDAKNAAKILKYQNDDFVEAISSKKEIMLSGQVVFIPERNVEFWEVEPEDLLD